MGTVELKLHLHKLVDRIHNEQLLQALYDFLKVRESEKPGKLWSSLTDEQKKEVLLAFEESEDEYNLISRENVIKKK